MSMNLCESKGDLPWFTVEPLDPFTYIISEYRHWEQAHSYLVLSAEKAVLIDTGLGVGNIRHIVEDITDLPVTVVTTHAHWDHIGGHGLFDNVCIHGADAGWLVEGLPIPVSAVRAALLRQPCDFPDGFDAQNYTPYRGQASRLLQDGDVIDLGERRLEVIHTPGHSPGHICLFEAGTGYLFTGDLIYKGELHMFYPGTDPAAFLDSVRKTLRLPVSRVLPGHFSLDLSAAIIARIEEAMAGLSERGCLHHGTGIIPCGEFSLRL